MAKKHVQYQNNRAASAPAPQSNGSTAVEEERVYINESANNSLVNLFSGKSRQTNFRGSHPVFIVDFSKIKLNQHHLIIENELREFCISNDVEYAGHAYISDGFDRVLCTYSNVEGVDVLVIHWAMRQTVIVKGDKTDL